MPLERIKQEINKELHSKINTIDPALNLTEVIDLYFKVLNFDLAIQTKNDLDGLKPKKTSTLNKCFVEESLDDESIGMIGDFNQKFEAFVKKVYYVLEQTGAISEENRLDPNKLQTLSPFLSALNKLKPYYLDNNDEPTLIRSEAKLKNQELVYHFAKGTTNKQYERLYQSSIKFDQYVDVNDPKLVELYNNKFELYLIRSIILRNKESHQSPGLKRIQAMQNLESTLIIELRIIDFLKQELTDGIKASHSTQLDFKEYIQGELGKYQKQSEQFVHLSLRKLAEKAEQNDIESLNDIQGSDVYRLRILGEGGSGKTTTLEYLVYRDCLEWIESDGQKKIPILLTLSNIREDVSIKDSIAKKLAVDLSVVEEKLETNTIKLYLDGVNEIVKNRESKKQRLKEISSLISEKRQLEVIVTDRYEFDSYQNNMFDLPTYGIQKLDHDQVRQFVIKYCQNSDHSYEDVLSIIESKVRIKELLIRPLLLSRAIEIIKIDNDLPEKEGQIIEKFIDLMLRREKDEKMDPLLNINDFKMLLAYVANKLWTESKTNISINEFRFKKLITEAADELGIEKHNAGYALRIGFELEILSKKDNLLQYYHESYIEFFASYYLQFEMY